MQLSLGIPTYNQGGFLRETVESVLHQDVPFHEIVVSNNYSTDSTAEVLAAIQQDYPGRIRVIMPPAHLTMAENWNFTVSQLTGDWFSLLSSDDLALPNFARSVQRAAGLSSKAVLVRGAWKNIGPNGEALEDHYLLTVSKVTHPPKTLYEQRFGPKGSFAAFALQRSVWEQVGGFPEDVTLLGDWGLWLLAGALGDIVYTGDLISQYRTGHQSNLVGNRHHIHMREMYTVYEKLLPRAAQLGGFGVPDWIQKASRQRFREALIGTSKKLMTGDRSLLIEAFRPWANATGEQTLFQRFERGDVLRDYNPMHAVRPLLRSLVSTLRHRRSVESH